MKGDFISNGFLKAFGLMTDDSVTGLYLKLVTRVYLVDNFFFIELKGLCRYCDYRYSTYLGK